MRIKLEFEGKEINPGDVIIVRPKKMLSAHTAKDMYEAAKKAFPDHHVVFLPPDYFLETYNKKEFAKFLANQQKYLEEDENE